MSEPIDLTVSDDDTVSEATAVRETNESMSRDSVSQRHYVPLTTSVSAVPTASFRPWGEIGEDNVDIDTLNQINNPTNDDDSDNSSDISRSHDNFINALHDPSQPVTVRFQHFNYVSSKERRNERWRKIQQEYRDKGIPLPPPTLSAKKQRRLELEKRRRLSNREFSALPRPSTSSNQAASEEEFGQPSLSIQATTSSKKRKVDETSEETTHKSK
jgi:hypothetical protein